MLTHAARAAAIVGLQPTVIASRAPHLALLEQSVQDSKNRGRASPVKAAKQLNFQAPKFSGTSGGRARRARRALVRAIVKQ